MRRGSIRRRSMQGHKRSKKSQPLPRRTNGAMRRFHPV